MQTLPHGTAITSPQLSAERSLGIVSIKGHRKEIKLSLQKAFRNANGCHSAMWNTWIYMKRMWIVIYIFEACLFMQTTTLLGFKSYPKWGKKCKWKSQSREVMSYWGQYNPVKEFNYKRYWALKIIAAIKARNTPFQMSSGWPRTLYAWEWWPHQQEPVPHTQLCAMDGCNLPGQSTSPLGMNLPASNTVIFYLSISITKVLESTLRH